MDVDVDPGREAPVYFEDIPVGERWTLGRVTLTEADVVGFAETYDPQPFHVDREAAAESPFGGLVASGWQTAAACMRVTVDGFLGRAAALGALAVEDLRWPNPVRPGDTLAVDTEALSKRPSESDDSRGVVRQRTTAANGDGEQVLHWESVVLFARRGAAE